MAVPVSRCVVGSVLKVPAGAKGAAWLIAVVHVPSEQTPISAQSLSAEQMLWSEVEVGRACDAVALGEGVAVSTSREKARRGMVDIMIRERMIKNECVRVLYTRLLARCHLHLVFSTYMNEKIVSNVCK